MTVGAVTRSHLRSVAPIGRSERRPTRFDIALGVGLAIVIQVEYHTDYADTSQLNWKHIAVGLLLAVPLVWRRVFPVAVGLGVTAVFCFQPEIVKPTPNTFAAAICLVVAVGALALYPRRWLTAFVCGALAGAMGVIGAWLDPNPKGLEGISMLLFILGIWIAAALLRQQTERVRRSEAKLVEERIAAQMRERELVLDERSRIARELHDVISHGIGVVVLQARGGRRVLDSDAERARLALDEIEKVSTDCLNEMRLMLDVLRVDDNDAQQLPQRGMTSLAELLEEFERAGLQIDYTVTGTERPLPPALDLSAFRIVQEALTNVVQHGDHPAATLTISYDDTCVQIDVTNPGAALSSPTPGHGLTGISERVQLFDGQATWGPRPGGGFGVHASLPTAVA